MRVNPRTIVEPVAASFAAYSGKTGKETIMDKKTVTFFVGCALSIFSIGAYSSPPANHNHPVDARSSVTVSFGAGLNTNQPGNAANHHVLPKEIKISRGGVVNFAVAGFHQIMVYQPGTLPEHIGVPSSGTFINYAPNLFYTGIAPAGGPLGTPASANPHNGSNRIESVSFPEAGRYLVICNIRGHFLDGMYAFVQVN